MRGATIGVIEMAAIFAAIPPLRDGKKRRPSGRNDSFWVWTGWVFGVRKDVLATMDRVGRDICGRAYTSKAAASRRTPNG
jgi:hypothetical protein